MKIISFMRTALSWVVLAAFLAPLVFIQGLYSPAVTGKTFLLEGLAIIAAALFVFAALQGERFYFARLRKWQVWLPAGLLLVEYLTSAVGIGFYESFWGVAARGDGLLMTTTLVALFYIVVLIADEGFWQRLFVVIAGVGVLSALVGLAQWLGLTQLGQVGGDRVGGLLGNAEFLASYLALSGFATLTLATYPNRFSWLKVKLLWALAAFEFAVAMLTATRGTILALGVVALVTLIYLAWQKGSVQSYARIILGVCVVVMVLGFALRGPLSRSSFEPLRRVAQISLTDETVSSRLFVWHGIVKQSLQKPLVGVGAEHVAQLFDRIYDPTKISEEWFDRSHNAFLDYFAEFGVVGAALYLAIVGLLIVGAYRVWKKEHTLRYALFALAGIVYAVQNFFAFDTPSTLLLLLILYAALWSGDVLPRGLPRAAWRTSLGVVLGLAILTALYPVIYKPYVANRALVEGYLYQVSDINRSVSALQRGLNEHTYLNLEYGYEIEDMYVNQQAPMLSGAALRAAYAFDANALIDIFGQYPYDARSALDIAQVLDGVPQDVTPNLVLQVEAAAKARQLSPLRAEAWYLLVNADISAASTAKSSADALEYYQDAIGALKEYSAMVPGLSRPKFVLAQLYLTINDPKDAEVYVKDLRASDPALLQSDPAFLQAMEAYERSQQ